MCEPGKQCHDGKSCGERLDQLRRLVWLLMIWVSILSLGLGASITLHVLLLRGRHDTEIARNDTFIPPTDPNFTFYIFDQNIKEEKLQWRKKNDIKGNTTIKVEQDGNYFLFFRVTLLSPNKGVNYLVSLVKKPDSNESSKITDVLINAMQNSTGFMGIGAKLTENTELNLVCSPAAQFDADNTYFGMIRF